MDLEGTIYELREDLEVYNKVRNRALAKTLDQDGYVRYGLYVERRRKHAHLHRIVAHKYLGPRPEGLVVNHKDGNKLNNHPSNLEYITAIDNTAHAKEIGLIPSGLDSQHAIDVEKVLTVYTLYMAGKKIIPKAKQTLGVSGQCVVRVSRGVSYPELHSKLINPEISKRMDRKRGLVLENIPAGTAERLYYLLSQNKKDSEIRDDLGISVKVLSRLRKIYDNSEVYPYSTLFT